MNDEALNEPVTARLLFREAGLSLLVVLGLLGLVEQALRSDLAFGLLPLAKPYYSYDVTRRVRHLDRLREEAPIDVLFVGSSIVRASIDPTRFDRILGKVTRAHTTSFNAGLSQMSPAGAKFYLERLWLARARPRYVLHGVREAELASRTHRPSAFKYGRVEPLWTEKSDLALMKASLIENLALLQYRGIFGRGLESFRDDHPLHGREVGELPTDARGFRKEPGKLARSKARRASRRNWQYTATPKKTRHRSALKHIDAIRRLCAERGITYVLFNVPEHPDRFATEQGPATFADYHQRIRKWATAKDVPFLDTTDASLEAFAKDAYFADYTHMSPKGAARLTTDLARRFASIYEPQQPRTVPCVFAPCYNPRGASKERAPELPCVRTRRPLPS